MNILLVTYKYPPHTSMGPARTAVYLAEYLSKNGYNVTVITSKISNEKEFEKTKDIEIHRLKVSTYLPDFLHRLFFIRELRKFLRLSKFKKYDILHILDGPDSIFLTNEITNNIPTVVSINEYYTLITSKEILNYPCPKKQIPVRYVYNLFLKSQLRKSLNQATILNPISNFVANMLKKELGIPENKMRVIYKGVDMSKFSPKTTKNKYTSHNILFVGFNTERKGLKYLLEALPEVVKYYPDTTLTAIGRIRKSFIRYIKEKNLEDKVNFIEEAPADKIPNFLFKANVFVVPTILEALGQSTIEAMATKTPIVTTDIGANSELVTKGAGILVQPRNSEQISIAIMKIFSSTFLAKKMGEIGRENAYKNFNKKEMINKIVKIYQEIK